MIEPEFVPSTFPESRCWRWFAVGVPHRFSIHLRKAIRIRHYSIRTEKAYVGWVKRFILYHHKRHPTDMAETEVAAFLSHLAVDLVVAPATQNQALNALSFLYKAVLARPLGDVPEIVRAKRPRRLPTVLTQEEIGRMLSRLKGYHWLIGCLLYGSGLRLMESVRLRVKDVDFGHAALFIRNAKSSKDRIVTLPGELNVPLERHLGSCRTLFERDQSDGIARVYLPYALERKYPGAAMM